MSKYIRHQPIIARQSDENISEDHWLKQFQKSLQKGAVQPKQQQSLFDQINSIMNQKSKYPSVEAAVQDMQERSGLTAYLVKVKGSDEEGAKKMASSDNYYERGMEDGVEDLKKHDFGADILSSIISQTSKIPENHRFWHEYARGYIEGSKMSKEHQAHELNKINSYLDKQTKKASDDNQSIDKKVDMTPMLMKKCPPIMKTLENCIRDSRGNLSVPAIIERLRSIHQGDVSESKDWDDDKLIILVSRLNLEAKKVNPDSYQNYGNLGGRDSVSNSEIDPSNTDAFFALNPAKI